jgi:hypothetical protein
MSFQIHTNLLNLLKKLYSFLFVDDLLESFADPVVVSTKAPKKKSTRDLAWLTLVFYVLFIFKPIVPVLSDKIAHTFWEQYHLITVHGTYGNAHVDQEIEKSTKQADKEKSTKSTSEEYAHIISAVAYYFPSHHFISRSYSAFKVKYPVSYSNIHYQPPKV